MNIDVIFGSVDDPVERTDRHVADRAGVKHRNRVLPVVPVPGVPLALQLTTSGPLPFDAARCWYCAEPAGGTADLPASGTVEFEPAGLVWDDVTWSYVRHWRAELAAQDAGTMLRYRLAAHVTGSDRWIYADNQADSALGATEFAVLVSPGAPSWTPHAIVYHIFVDRFYPGDGRAWQQPGDLSGFYGGTLRGVIDKLDYIQSLGFNTLWLSPVFASPSHHGYDTTDLFRVEPRLGSNEDLLDLFRQAHERGLRVLLDLAVNHWSNLHPTFQDAQAHERSPYHDWYKWDRWPDGYLGYFGSRIMPELNLAPGPARNHVLDAARYWLEQGADGYRLDFAYGPPHDFWARFGQACRLAKPDCWLFGEVVHTPERQATYAARLDGALDFMLAKALRNTFGRARWDLAEFESFLGAHEAYFPASFSRPAFLDNHDMNRFLHLAGDDTSALMLAALALFTLSGPPIVYYGTEVGVTQERPVHDGSVGRFEEARLPMKWGSEQNEQLREHFRRLLGLRLNYPVLATGLRRVLHLDPHAGTYAYLRAANPARYTPGDALIAINAGAEPANLEVLYAGPESASDHLAGHTTTVESGQLRLRLPPRSGAFIA